MSCGTLALLTVGLVVCQLPSSAQTVHRWNLAAENSDRFFTDGRPVRVLSADRVSVFVSFAYRGPKGNPFRGKSLALVEVVNNSDRRVHVIPQDFTLEAVGPRPTKFEQADPEKKARSIERWGQFAAGMTRLSADFRQQREYTYTTGSAQYAGQSGIYSSSTVTTKPDEGARREGYRQAKAVDQVTARDAGAVRSIALRSNTLSPGQSIQGYVFFNFKGKRRDVLLRIPLGDEVFEFAYSPSPR